MEVVCRDWDHWSEAVDIVTSTVNRLTNKSGYSPIQRMLGYTPRVPGGLLTGGHNDWSTSSRARVGDLQVQRAVSLRRAAAVAFHNADASQALRSAVRAGPRLWQDYQVGQTVYYWKKGMERAKKDSPAFWHGPAKVILVSLPNSVWVSHHGRIVKAAPEQLRPASDEEKFTLTDWIEAISEVRKELSEREAHPRYITLEDFPPETADMPEGGDLVEPELQEPVQPVRRLREKTPARHVVFRDAVRPEDVDDEVPEPDPKRVRAPLESAGEPIVPEEEPDIYEPSIQDEHRAEIGDDVRSVGEVPSSREEVVGRAREAEDGLEEEQRPSKRLRIEFMEILMAKIDKLNEVRKRKEIRLNQLPPAAKERFLKAIGKEVSNNLESGAYELLSHKESEEIRRSVPDLVMKSRYVLTEKGVHPEDVEKLTKEGLLIDSPDGRLLKAKARHVMKGFSESGAEFIEATTPQVAKESVFFTLQMLASHGWQIGHLDFTQAFHSGGPINRELYAELPIEGLPGAHPRQLLRLRKTCYGLTDGPLAWYQHLGGELKALGYQMSAIDPCLYFLRRDDRLVGIIALATDDMVHGGEQAHWDCMESLRQRYKMGKYAVGNGRFTGKEIVQNPDGSILVHQAQYIRENVKEIPLERARRRQRYSRCTDDEVTALRGLIGSLAWVGKESRPDICGRVALLQQCFPDPLVKDMLDANKVARELLDDAQLGVLVQPIPLERLRVGVVTDASWANAGGTYSEECTKDTWEESDTMWTRWHNRPRTLSFHPGAAAGGPDLHSITRDRITVTRDGECIDAWDGPEGIRQFQGEAWTGCTHFVKTEIADEYLKPVNERFLQLAKRSSQGGYILIYYDSELETSGKAEKVTIASWKSYKIKRCTVNTLSAECQSMLQGIGSVHWHRFFLAESQGESMSLERWEEQISRTPFIAVTDSKSLYDTATKCRNIASQIDDKRTAIDVAILKRDLAKTQGQVRWVAGVNMISDSLTKRMSPGFLQGVMRAGRWALSESGREDFDRVQASLNMFWCRCEFFGTLSEAVSEAARARGAP